MAAGNRVLPGPPALQPMRADQAITAAQEPIGPEMLAPPPGSAERTGSPPSGAGTSAAGTPGRVRGRAWGGTGGRWLIWVFRGVLWLVLLLVGYRGVVAIVAGAPGAGGGTGAAAAPAGQRAFPVSLARAYALAFGQVYLNYSAATAAHRAAELAAFLPPGSDPQLGWNGAGAQALQFEQVAGVSVISPHQAVVTLLARVGGHLIEVGVPIYATRTGMVVSGRPALLPPPSNVALPAPAAVTQDPAAKRALKRMLPGFFRAYGTGDAARLDPFLPRGTVITGLGSMVSFGGLVELIVPAAAGQVRHVVVTVSWRPAGQAQAAGGAVRPGAGPGSPAPAPTSPAAKGTSPAARTPVPASVQMTYALTVVRRGASWLVRSIGPAAAQPWPSS
jgi:Conjugative transposon protein TcpC